MSCTKKKREGATKRTWIRVAISLGDKLPLLSTSMKSKHAPASARMRCLEAINHAVNSARSIVPLLSASSDSIRVDSVRKKGGRQTETEGGHERERTKFSKQTIKIRIENRMEGMKSTPTHLAA